MGNCERLKPGGDLEDIGSSKDVLYEFARVCQENGGAWVTTGVTINPEALRKIEEARQRVKDSYSN
jgi:hypothetical protein